MHTDVGKLRQCLVNLLNNGAKFSENSEVMLDVWSETAGGREWTVFRVRDRGIGIGPEQMTAIFQPFCQGDESIVRRYGGTGVGLSITHAYCAMMGGEISVESTVGQGSIFTLRLPSRLSDMISASPVRSRGDNGGANAAKLPRKALKILLVEDNRVNRRMIHRLLSRMGHQVKIAVNGKHALSILEQGSFDIILMDIELPEMDGLEATRRIRQREEASGGHVPIAAITAHALVEDRERCIEVGMDEFLAKPIYADELDALIVRMVAVENTSPGHGGHVRMH